MFGALKRGFRSMASLILVRNVVGELQPKRTLAASRGFLAAVRLSCSDGQCIMGRVRWHFVLLKCPFVMTAFCSDVRQQAPFQDDLTLVAY